MPLITSPIFEPTAYFTNNFSNYGHVIRYSVTDSSPFFWENESMLCYVRSGCGSIIVNSMPYSLTAGSFLWLQTYHVFSFHADLHTPLDLEFIIYPYSQMVLFDFQIPNSQIREIVLSGLIVAHLKGKIKKEAEELLSDYDAEAAINDHPSLMIRHCLIHRLNQLPLKAIDSLATEKLENMSLERKIFLSIQTESLSQITEKELCERFSITDRQLNRLLRKICMGNFSHVISHARVSNASSLMLRNLPLNEIAANSGFATESSLFRAFKKFRGCSPNEYRTMLTEFLNCTITSLDDIAIEISSYVLEHFHEAISEDSCAEALYIPRDQINRILHAKYPQGGSFHQFVIKCRLRYAAGLLAVSNMLVLDIALDSGFNSIHTFIRLFKQEFGKTPAQYRQEKRSQ